MKRKILLQLFVKRLYCPAEAVNLGNNGSPDNIRIKGHWTTNAALYIIMVGRPGLSKTPPLEAVFRPLRKRDFRAL